jgi:hypothetical protein
MKRFQSAAILFILLFVILVGCGKTQLSADDSTKTESPEMAETSKDDVLAVSDNEVAVERSDVMDYFQKNGKKKGNSYSIEKQLTDEISSVWILSEEKPDCLSCHAMSNNGLDFYFRYYQDSSIISYNLISHGTMGEKESSFSALGIADGRFYHEGDTITPSKMMIDGTEIDPTQFTGAAALNGTVQYFFQTLYRQLEDFGIYETENNQEDARTVTEMAQLLPAEDECVHLTGTEKVETNEIHIPDEYKKDAGTSSVYNAVKKGDTEYLFTLLGEADRIKNVKDNSFSSYIEGLLNDMNFYEATELQQSFLEMYAVYGSTSNHSIIEQGIKGVYASGFSENGEGNSENIIDKSYVRARCLLVETESGTWFLFTRQLIGSINTYAQESYSMFDVQQVEGDQFALEIFQGIDPFTFTKVEDAVFNTGVAEKAYQFGCLIQEFNDTFVKTRDEENKKEEASKYEPGLGMTKQEVLNSAWGKPESINKTETNYGIHEQWVYGNRRYVYFDDDVVTAIQDNGKDIY